VNPQPPRRSTHTSGGPKNLLVYDRWGRFGRPVLLLHGLLFDRTMWWPVAAELATSTRCTVLAPDLPGHGDTPGRTGRDTSGRAGHGDTPGRAGHDPAVVAGDLAGLVHRLDLHRAPIVVGHAESAGLADAFADRFAVHEVLTVDDLGPAAGRTEIPEHYRPYARRRHDPDLLAAYPGWRAAPRTCTFPHLTDPAGFAAGLRARLA
jgi:pimeloyl-ACP methyl ester carboxylesterase